MVKKYGFGVDIADSLQIARKRNNLERKQGNDAGIYGGACAVLGIDE